MTAVCHVVTFTLKPGTPEDAISKLASALDDLAGRSSALSYFHGRDLRFREGNADYAVTAVFKSEDAFAQYMTSPEHLSVVRDLVAPHLESRSAVQFAIASPHSLQC